MILEPDELLEEESVDSSMVSESIAVNEEKQDVVEVVHQILDDNYCYDEGYKVLSDLDAGLEFNDKDGKEQ